MNEIYFCPSCKKAFSVSNGVEFCECGETLMSTGLPVKTWRQMSEEEKQEKRKEWAQLKNIILTTCASVDGYRAVAQYGLVFGECLFKGSFSSILNKALDNFDSKFTLSENEIKGTTALLERAREYATRKMIHHAVDRGANAVVGIAAESFSGDNIMHITIYGTAVKLERIEET